MSDFLETEEKIVQMLRTVYDPEIPVNIYDLGLVYSIDVSEDGHVDIDMTLTAPNCPVADFIIEDVRMKVESGRSKGCRRKHCVRAGVGQKHDERRSKT